MAITVNEAPIKQPMYMDPPANTMMHQAWVMFFKQLERAIMGKDSSSLIAANSDKVDGFDASATIADGVVPVPSSGWKPYYIDDFTSAQQTITSAGSLTLAHGLVDENGSAVAPNEAVQIWLVCQTGEHGYTAGDVLHIPLENNDTALRGAYATTDATNIYVRYANSANFAWIANKSTGSGALITNANWKAVFFCRYSKVLI